MTSAKGLDPSAQRRGWDALAGARSEPDPIEADSVTEAVHREQARGGAPATIDHLGRAHVLEAGPDVGRCAGLAEVVLDDPVFERTWELLQAWVYETALSGVEITPEGYADEWVNCRTMARAELPKGFVPLEPVKFHEETHVHQLV